MTISTTHNYVSYNGNDATVVFPITFQYSHSDEIYVYAVDEDGNETALAESVDYEVTGGQDSETLPSTGTLEMIAPLDGSGNVIPPATGTKIRIERWTRRTQARTHTVNDNFPPKTVEGSYDARVLLAQDAWWMGRRAVKQSLQDFIAGSEVELELPSPEDDNLLGWSDGQIVNFLQSDVGETISAAQLLARLLTVDGSGSGLDADTVDGIHGSQIRTKLAANTNFYVRTDGNDSNTGLANTAAGAFLTIQGALNALGKLWDFNKFTPTVNVQAGTWAPFLIAHPWIGGAYPIISGAGVGSSTIAATADSQSLVTVGDFAVLGITGFSLSAGGFSGVVGLDSFQGGILDFDTVSFGAMSVGVRATRQGMINQTGSFTIAGDLAAFAQVFTLSRLNLANTITVNGGLTITHFLNVQQNSLVSTGGVNLTIAGAGAGAGTTGTKFVTASDGRIDDSGTTWPGATVGTKSHVDGPSAAVTAQQLARWTNTSGNALEAAPVEITATAIQPTTSNAVTLGKTDRTFSSVFLGYGASLLWPDMGLSHETGLLTATGSLACIQSKQTGAVAIAVYNYNSSPSAYASIQLINSVPLVAEFALRNTASGSVFECTGPGPSGIILNAAHASGGLDWRTNNTSRGGVDQFGNTKAGTGFLTVTAVDGFLYVPMCSGTPTGTPRTITGMAAIVINRTSNKLYFFSGGWRDAGP